jgi:hypothetical protein
MRQILFPTTLRLCWFLENGRLTCAWRPIEDQVAAIAPHRCAA